MDEAFKVLHTYHPGCLLASNYSVLFFTYSLTLVFPVCHQPVAQCCDFKPLLRDE